MDYKELIERLNAYSAKHQRHGGITAEAADTIETLLSERDALLSEIKGDCYFCAFETGACVKCDNGEAWQWRAHKKRAAHEQRYD